MKYFQIIKAEHACLYQRYDLKTDKFVDIGSKGTYTKEDKETGAEYRALGQGRKGNKIAYSSDLRIGFFYSPNVFIIGRMDQFDKPLDFEEIEKFVRKFWGNNTQRALLPRGYEKGIMTWDHALYFTPVERQIPWDMVVGRIKAVDKNAEILSNHQYFIEFLVD